MDWMLLPLRRYAQFSGRAQRKEYWMFFLFVLIVFAIAMVIDNLLGFGTTTRYAAVTDNSAAAGFNSTGGIVTLLAMLALLLPSIAVAVRRLHDIDRSGWWLLIGLIPLAGAIVLLVFYCTDGTRGPNRFGADPKEGNPADPAERPS